VEVIAAQNVTTRQIQSEPMDLTEPDEVATFRAEVREWLAANVASTRLPSLDTEAGFAAHREWERRLYDARLAVVTWPAGYGGRDASLLEWLVFEEEYWAADAPSRVSQNGIFLLAPTLFEYGTTAQKDRFLAPMASAEEVWAQGWSEPGAGSDLAALRSRADKVAGGWRLSGQKTWSTRAAFADWMFGLFRSDPDSDRHHGLTYLMFALTAPGVTVRPIRQLDGEPGFAEVFLDDVFVPDDDVSGGGVLGEVGKGWQVAMSTTTSERGLTLRSPGRFMASADRLVELYRRTRISAPEVAASAADDVAQAWMDADAYRLYVLGTALRALDGQPIGAESSANKLFWSRLDVAIHQSALAMLGERATLTADATSARWLDGYEFSLAGPIYAGTNEVQRNLVAERVLGLPRR
jgi:alkylation response protein AidB-like acyl-CoA dehydrogenase